MLDTRRLVRQTETLRIGAESVEELDHLLAIPCSEWNSALYSFICPGHVGLIRFEGGGDSTPVQGCESIMDTMDTLKADSGGFNVRFKLFNQVGVQIGVLQCASCDFGRRREPA